MYALSLLKRNRKLFSRTVYYTTHTSQWIVSFSQKKLTFVQTIYRLAFTICACSPHMLPAIYVNLDKFLF